MLFLFFLLLLQGVASTTLTLLVVPPTVNPTDVREGRDAAVVCLLVQPNAFNISVRPRVSSRETETAQTTVVIFSDSQFVERGFNEQMRRNPYLVTAWVDNHRLCLRLGADKDFRAYTHEVLHAIVLQRQFSAGYGPWPRSATFIIDKEVPTLQPMREGIEVGFTFLSLLFSISSNACPLGMLAFARLALLARVHECHSELDFTLHPTRVSFGVDDQDFYFGCLLMNFSLVFIGVMTHVVVLEVKNGDSKNLCWIMATHSFPSVHHQASMFLGVGMTVAGLQMTYAGGVSPIRYVIAILLLIMFAIFMGASIGYVINSWPKHCTYKHVDGGKNSQPFYGQWSVEPTTTKKEFLEMWACNLTPYVGEKCKFYVYACASACVLCVIVSLIPTRAGPGGCRVRSILCILVGTADVVAVFMYRPFNSWVEQRFQEALAVIQILVSIAALIETFLDNPDSWAEYAAELLAIMCYALIAGKYGYEAYLYRWLLTPLHGDVRKGVTAAQHGALSKELLVTDTEMRPTFTL